MKKSKILMLLLCLVMILAVSAVSAAEDTSDSPLQSVDDGAVDVVASSDADVLGVGEKNFTDLKTLIGDDDVTVNLEYNYEYVAADDTAYTNGIPITKNVVINGNGKVISGSDGARIFNIASTGKLTLNNVTLCHGLADGRGGAIYNDGGTLTVNGSTFDGNDLTNRRVNSGGAAIYNNGGTVTLNNTAVINNLKNIIPRGGYDTTDDLCSAAVASSGTLTVINSYFYKNSGSYGGAILINETGVLTVSGTTFEDNYAFNGGAIDIVDDASYSISNCTFKGNVANGTGSDKNNIASGGAISAQEKASGSVISNCIFEDNVAAYGGAIDAVITEIVGCNFTNNRADSSYSGYFKGQLNGRGGSGGAIRISTTDKTITPKITIRDSEFNSNGGTGNCYGLLLNKANSNITGSSFTQTMIDFQNGGSATLSDNTYDNEGLSSYNVDIRSSTSIPLTLGEGQIPKISSAKLYTDSNNFTRLQEIVNHVTGQIYLTVDVAKLDSEAETFANGIIIGKSITIYGEGFTISSDSGKVFNVADGATLTLYNASITGDGSSAIINNGQVKLQVASPSAFSNVGLYAIENNGIVYESGLTTFTQLNNLIGLVNSGVVKIYRSKITETDAEKELFTNGIVIDKDVSIVGDYSTYNKRVETIINANNDGRIFNVTNGATLTLTYVNLTNGNADYGGAVYVNEGATLNSSTCNFVTNVATVNGNAIYSAGTLELFNTTASSTQADIVSTGTISSTVNAVFIDNQTIPSVVGATVHPNATLTDDNGNLINDLNFKITVGTQELETSFEDGKYTATHTFTTAGEAIVSTNYNAVKTTGTYDVAKAASTLTITVPGTNVVYPGDVVVSYDTNSTLKSAVVTVKGETNPVGVVDTSVAGKVTVAVGAGTYTIVITVGDDNHNETSASADFTVDKGTPTITVASSDVNYPADVIVNITSDVSGTYSVSVGSKSQFVSIAAGVTQSVAFEDLDVNENGYIITAYYSETENYNYAINNAVTVKVLPAQGPKATVLTAIASEVTDSSAVINITLTDADGNKLTKLVTVRVGDSIVPVNVVNGTGSLPLSDLAIGKYTANAVFAGDENYTNSSASVSFEVKPIYPTAAVMTATVETTYKDAVIKVALTDKYGAKLNDVVTVTIGNDTYNVTVTNGEGSLALSNLAVGFYSANVAFAGDANHTSSSYAANFAISNAVLLANNTKRGWNSPYDYYATLVDANDKPIAGKEITFVIDGTTYKNTTDADGIAKVAAKLDVGTHSVVVTNPDTGANFTVTAVIVERIQGYGDITKDYLGPESYVVQVFGDDGNPVGEGEVVQVRFAGKTYNMTTNASGYIIRTINFVPGFYAVYSSYAGYQTPQTGITVNQILKVAAVTASKSGKSFKLKASLKSSSGKAISDVKIKFTFRGNVYYGTTNAKGVASCKVSSSVI